MINLPCFGIIVVLTGDGGGSITSDLHEDLPPKIGPDYPDEMIDEISSIADYNTTIDGIEALILGHAVAGIDIESPAYIEGIETAVQAAGNNT